MPDDRWQRIQDVYLQAIDLDAESRKALLETCEPDLRAEIDRLLEAESHESLFDRSRAVHDVFSLEMPPETVGSYHILRELGRGGMGVVYLGRRKDLDTTAAIKLLRDAALSPARRERFLTEQRVLAQLRHPGIAQLYDADTLSDGTPYFVMEFVDGLPLLTHCERHACLTDERLAIFRQICAAVQFAHGRAVVHRDLKPSNVMVRADDDGPRIKLLDFGIAKQLLAIGAPTRATAGPLRLYTPAYAAPEQISDEPVGVFTDVYSLGVVLYELLTGRSPYGDVDLHSPRAVEEAVLMTEPPRPSSYAPTLSDDLDAICLKALRKNPTERYQSVEALARDLDRYEEGLPLDARTPTTVYRLSKFVRRHRTEAVAALAVVVMLASMLAFYVTGITAARDDALAEAARAERIQRFMIGLFEGEDEAVGPSDTLRVRTLLDRGVREATYLEGEPSTRAELFGTLGGLYQHRGEFDRADSLLSEALALQRAEYGSEHPRVAEGLVALGLLRLEQADYDSAEAAIREGLEIARRAASDAHPSFAAALTALGGVLQARGDHPGAIDVLEEAVALRAANTQAGVALSESMTELANAHYYAGSYAVADSINRLVLALDQRIHGRRHPLVAKNLVNLGATQFQLNDNAAAELYYRQALAINLAYYGPDHLETSATQFVLGQVLGYTDSLDAAEEMLTSSLRTRERAYGREHPRVANVLNELGHVERLRGNPVAAEAYYLRMLDIYDALYDEEHYLKGFAYSNLASIYHDYVDYPRGEEAMREAERIFRKSLSEDHMNTAIARVKLGNLLQYQEKWDEALPYLLAGYETFTRQPQPPVAWLRVVLGALVVVNEALGRLDDAAEWQSELDAVAET